ncbi:MAG TPA: hypothetical protein VM261_25325 [Kofleriaceae bacterium]|nr:hypothetical protein [Kofleriaceae bacterium]
MSELMYPGAKKVAIVGMEIDVTLTAQYNPKEISFEKSAEWAPHKTTKNNGADLEYSSSPARTLSMELMFDGYEEDLDVSKEYVDKLMQLIEVMDADSNDESRKRPSIVQVVWPEKATKFQGVLQSVSTKYTMFNPDGKPVRATCNIKVLEVAKLREFLAKASAKERSGW